MITRIWRGWTTADNANTYEQLLLTTIFPGIVARSIAGFRSISLDRRDVPEGVEFMTTIVFSSMDAVKEFAGNDYAHSVVPPAAKAVLSHYDAAATHYERVTEIATP